MRIAFPLISFPLHGLERASVNSGATSSIRPMFVAIKTTEHLSASIFS